MTHSEDITLTPTVAPMNLAGVVARHWRDVEAKTLYPGFSVRPLWSEPSGRQALLFEIAPGAVYPELDLHTPGAEEVFVVSGTFCDGVNSYPAGTFIHHPAGSSHITPSGDGRELAGIDRKIVPIHIQALPGGWLGKVHALHQAARAATGEWILLTIADAHFAPTALRRAVAHVIGWGKDDFAVLPRVPRQRSFSPNVAVSVFGGLFLQQIHVANLESPNGKAFAGSGGFNLVRRAAGRRFRHGQLLHRRAWRAGDAVLRRGRHSFGKAVQNRSGAFTAHARRSDDPRGDDDSRRGQVPGAKRGVLARHLLPSG